MGSMDCTCNLIPGQLAVNGVCWCRLLHFLKRENEKRLLVDVNGIFRHPPIINFHADGHFPGIASNGTQSILDTRDWVASRGSAHDQSLPVTEVPEKE